MLYSLFLSLLCPSVDARTPFEMVGESQHLSLALQKAYREYGSEDFLELYAPRGWGVPMSSIGDQQAYPPFPEKQVRNAYAGDPQSHETDNFVIWWGPDGDVQESSITALGVELEHIWTVQIVQMGLMAPEMTDAWKFNEYIGNLY